MIIYILKVFSILFLAIGPIENSIVFAGLTSNLSSKNRRMTAFKASITATGILFGFLILGYKLLNLLKIQIYSFQIAGGIFLLLVAINMVMKENQEKEIKKDNNMDYSVFPLAIPLMAGPASLIISMNLFSEASGNYMNQAIILIVILIIMIFSYVLFLGADYIVRFLGIKSSQLIVRLLGIILGSLAVDLIIKALSSSCLFIKNI